MSKNIEKRIKETIESENPILFRAYGILPVTEKILEYTIEEILRKYSQEDIIASVYTATKELALNAVKANVKRVLFKENNIDLDNEEDFKKGMGIFKENLSDEWMEQYAKKSKEENFHVEVLFNFNSYRLIIEVINNTAISEKEDKRIRSKFQKGMKYDNIAEFYMEGGDSSEGAGMGIVLVSMLLKAQEMDPHLFTIRSDFKTKTTARIEFPLSEDYTSKRERHS